MLSTGVNTPIGIRVLGRNLDDVVRGADEVARVVKGVPGAVDVLADPIRGKPYIEIRLDRERAARLGVRAERRQRADRDGPGRAASSRRRSRGASGTRWSSVIPAPVARMRSRSGTCSSPAHGQWPGPGSPAPRVRLGAALRGRRGPGRRGSGDDQGRERAPAQLRPPERPRARRRRRSCEDARAALAREARLPVGVFAEFTGQFEHELRARRTLTVVIPIVILLIFAILYWTYHDLADAALMMLAVPGAIAGGLFFQWLMGLKLSVTVWVGYIACFGMATSTGIIMLVYLREAVARGGGLEPDVAGRPAAGRAGWRRPSPPAQAAHRGDRRARAGPHALVDRRRVGSDPADGRARAGGHPRRRRGHRPVPAHPLLLGPPPPMERGSIGRIRLLPRESTAVGVPIALQDMVLTRPISVVSAVASNIDNDSLRSRTHHETHLAHLADRRPPGRQSDVLCDAFAEAGPFRRGGIRGYGWGRGYYGPGWGYRQVYRPYGYGMGGYGRRLRHGLPPPMALGYGGYGMGYPAYGLGGYGMGYPGYGMGYPGVYGTSISIGSPLRRVLDGLVPLLIPIAAGFDTR